MSDTLILIANDHCQRRWLEIMHREGATLNTTGNLSTFILAGRLRECHTTLYRYYTSGVIGAYSREEQKWHKVTGLFRAITSELEGFEAEYHMDSETFYTAFQSGEIESERVEFHRWRSAYTAYLHMRQRFGLSR